MSAGCGEYLQGSLCGDLREAVSILKPMIEGNHTPEEKEGFERALVNFGAGFGTGVNSPTTDDYTDPYFTAAYEARYGIAYCWEYALLYGLVLEDMKKQGYLERFSGEHPLRVSTMGCGGLADAWSLLYAAANVDESRFFYRSSGSSFAYARGLCYTGVDLAEWGTKFASPERWLARCGGYNFYKLKNGATEFLADTAKLDKGADILFFPRILSEFDESMTENFMNALEQKNWNKYGDHLYLCIAHSSKDNEDRKNNKEKKHYSIGEFEPACEEKLLEVLKGAGYRLCDEHRGVIDALSDAKRFKKVKSDYPNRNGREPVLGYSPLGETGAKKPALSEVKMPWSGQVDEFFACRDQEGVEGLPSKLELNELLSWNGDTNRRALAGYCSANRRLVPEDENESNERRRACAKEGECSEDSEGVCNLRKNCPSTTVLTNFVIYRFDRN